MGFGEMCGRLGVMEKNDRRRERREGERFDRRVLREKENVVVFGPN